MYGNCFFFIFFFKKIESMFIFIFLLLISNGVSCEEKNILNNEFINGTGNNIDVILNHLISQYSARSQVRLFIFPSKLMLSQIFFFTIYYSSSTFIIFNVDFFSLKNIFNVMKIAATLIVLELWNG